MKRKGKLERGQEAAEIVVRTLRGELQPDAGNFERPSQLVIAHVAQELDATDRLAIEFVMDGDVELRATERAIAAAEAREAGAARLALVHDEDGLGARF